MYLKFGSIKHFHIEWSRCEQYCLFEVKWYQSHWWTKEWKQKLQLGQANLWAANLRWNFSSVFHCATIYKLFKTFAYYTAKHTVNKNANDGYCFLAYKFRALFSLRFYMCLVLQPLDSDKRRVPCRFSNFWIARIKLYRKWFDQSTLICK